MARTRISVVIVAMSLALALAACGKKKGEEAAKSGAPGAAAKAAAAKSGLSVFPKDTSFVLGLSFDKVRGTKLWEQFGKEAVASAGKDLEEMKATCGIDAVSDFQSVMVGGKSFEDEQSILIVVKGKWDEAKVNKCITEVAKKENEQVEITKEGKLTAYKGDGETMWAAWMDGGTVLLGQNKDAVAAAAAGTSTVTDNPAIAELIGKVDTTAMFWIASVVPAEQAGDMQEAIGSKPDGLYASLNMPKALDAAVGLRFADDASAKAAADKIGTEIKNAGAKEPMMAAYLKNVTATAAGKDAVVSIKLDEAQMDQLVSMVKAYLPMLMMGAMGGMGGGMGGGDMGGGGIEME